MAPWSPPMDWYLAGASRAGCAGVECTICAVWRGREAVAGTWLRRVAACRGCVSPDPKMCARGTSRGTREKAGSDTAWRCRQRSPDVRELREMAAGDEREGRHGHLT